MNFLKTASPSMYSTLSKHKPGSSGFDGAWKSLAQSQPDAFNKVQHDFIQASHYQPAANKIKQTLGFDVSKYSLAIQNVLWSTAVQHGTGGALSVFKAAGIKPGMSESEIIRRVYAERGANNGKKYFSKSSPEIRASVVKRFASEMQDALNMLK